VTGGHRIVLAAEVNIDSAALISTARIGRQLDPGNLQHAS
jgi:hypothetical protein